VGETSAYNTKSPEDLIYLLVNYLYNLMSQLLAAPIFSWPIRGITVEVKRTSLMNFCLLNISQLMQKVRHLQCVQQYFEKHNIPLGDITAVASDDAPAMIGRYRGFPSLLKEKAPAVKKVQSYPVVCG